MYKIAVCDDEVNIVFLTSSADYVYDGYDAMASAYLLKPVSKDKIEKPLIKDWHKKSNIKHIIIKEKGIAHKIKWSDILYIESKGKKVVVITISGHYTTYAKLSELFQKLSNDIFVCCHKSYAVNLNYVQSIKNDGFYMHQGHFVPISRANYKIVKEAFIQFIEA